MKPLIAIAALFGCTACQSIGWSTPLDSQFVTPSLNGDIQELDDFFGNQPTPLMSQTTGNQVSYHVSFDPDLGVRGHAGVVPGAVVTDFASATNTMTMTGFYRVEWEIYETATTNNIQLEQQGKSGGNVTLVADINAGTFVGTSDQDSNLSVNGAFTGNDLSGTVTYRGVEGDLEGLIGGNEAVAAFHGNDARTVFAGGFIAN